MYLIIFRFKINLLEEFVNIIKLYSFNFTQQMFTFTPSVTSLILNLRQNEKSTFPEFFCFDVNHSE